MTERGFTLVEVLAALLVFSIAILGLTRSGTESVRAVTVLEHKSFAGIVADNQLVRARLKPLETGVQTGEETTAGRAYEWRLETRETENAGFYRMVVTVREKDKEQDIITRTAFRGAAS